jgi:hypothetical protein
VLWSYGRDKKAAASMRRHILSSRRGGSDRTRRTIDVRPCARLPCVLCSASSTWAACMMGSVRALALQSFSPLSFKKGPCSLRSRQARAGVGRFSPWVLSVRSSLTTLSDCLSVAFVSPVGLLPFFAVVYVSQATSSSSVRALGFLFLEL